MNVHGHFNWNEFVTRDVDRAKHFYSETIGWTWHAQTRPDRGTYWVAMMNGVPVGGIFPAEGPDYESVPDGWMPYLAVDDVDARVKKAVAALVRRVAPAGCVDLGPKLGLPKLPDCEIMLYSSLSDPRARGALRTLGAAFRANAA